VITLVVFVFSCVAVYSVISDVLGDQGQFLLSRFLLSLLGIIAFIMLMRKKNMFAVLNIMWFLPQIIVLAERFVDPLYDGYAERTIYDLTLSISSVFVIGIEKAPDVFLRIGFNLVGIAGFVLSLMVALALSGKRGNGVKS
jgi:hypothetical protein